VTRRLETLRKEGLTEKIVYEEPLELEAEDCRVGIRCRVGRYSPKFFYGGEMEMCALVYLMGFGSAHHFLEISAQVIPPRKNSFRNCSNCDFGWMPV
jgi:hypothetical protein